MRFLENNETIYNYKRIYPFVKPYLPKFALVLLLAFPIGSLDAVIAMSLKPYMDLVVVDKALQDTWKIPCLIIAFSLVQGVLTYVSTYLNDWVGAKVTNNVKRYLYEKLLRENASFFDSKTSGAVQKEFGNDADSACNGLLGNLKTVVARVFSSISLVGVLIYNSWQLAIIAVAVLGVSVAPLFKLKALIKSATEKSESEISGLLTSYNEVFSGNKVISSYNLYNTQGNKFIARLDRLFKLRMKITRKTAWLSPMTYTIGSIGIAAVIGMGSHLVISGAITSGSFVSFIAALVMLYTPLRGLSNNAKNMQTSLLALGRIVRLMDREPDIVDNPNAIEFPGLKDSIVFENVNFGYRADVPVLNDVSFKVKKGEMLALVGDSGGGKTTIVNLLPRFYNINSGAIRIDGTNITDMQVDSLREHIAVVMQDNFLFPGTVKENILLGKKDATEEELNEAIKNSYLEKFIADLPNGIDTEIGERGMLLSGGEKQRISIARAFIKNAPIVILDEATSALDSRSEAIVQKALDNLMRDKTIFVIAHRLSTIQNATRIVVIRAGEIVEIGSHNELMSLTNGFYRKLNEIQFKREVV